MDVELKVSLGTFCYFMKRALIWKLIVLFVFLGSPSLRSPTENSIASLVSAAAIVKAKSESEGECQVSTGKYSIDRLSSASCKIYILTFLGQILVFTCSLLLV